MSDFIHNGWSLFVAAATVVSLVACLVLLAIASRRKVIPNDPTTGHVWDEDLREYNNPLPRWWMGLFVITVLFSGGYLLLYPGLGSMRGTLDWSSSGELAADEQAARQAMAPVYAKFANLPAAELARDAQAMGIGERLFLNNCAGCHGSDARGSKGFPDLTDSDWMYGGTPERIEETIAKGRTGMMPPMAAAVGNAEDVRNVAQYVLSLSGGPYNSLAAELGKAKFTACAACHGLDGKGNAQLGAPNLTDKVWLHGWGEEAIVAIVNSGRTNVMPAHADRLSPEQIHVLAAYVWSKSNAAARAKALE
jgi:cytochrome c oxidase cbb3-type subunit 3